MQHNIVCCKAVRCLKFVDVWFFAFAGDQPGGGSRSSASPGDRRRARAKGELMWQMWPNSRELGVADLLMPFDAISMPCSKTIGDLKIDLIVFSMRRSGNEHGCAGRNCGKDGWDVQSQWEPLWGDNFQSRFLWDQTSQKFRSSELRDSHEEAAGRLLPHSLT